MNYETCFFHYSAVPAKQYKKLVKLSCFCKVILLNNPFVVDMRKL